MKGQILWALIGFALGLALVGGCSFPFFPNVDVQIPATVQVVLDDMDSYTGGADEPLVTVEPGAVMDDLATLDGCWASVHMGKSVADGLGFFTVYRFDSGELTFTRWSGFATETGELWPAMPLLSAETGSFTVHSPAVLYLTIEQYFSNTDPDTGRVTGELHEQPGPSETIVRPALVTLAGDQMLLYIDVDTAADVGPEAWNPVFRQFECPAVAD